MQIFGKKRAARNKARIPVLGSTFLLVCAVVFVVAALIIETRALVFQFSDPDTEAVAPFPLGVDPGRRLIVEDPTVDTYLETDIPGTAAKKRNPGWLDMLAAKLAVLDWLQNLASPTSRILVIREGERKEEIVESIGGILHWDDAERAYFSALVEDTSPALSEGKFFPGRYVVGKDATPEDIAIILNETFTAEILSRYTPDIEAVVPLPDALTMASLLEREAYDFEDMRYISGIIWNRLFLGMNLQLDATLQYAKGNLPSEPAWWPTVNPKDKYIDSLFNTYEHAGLPPAPIANPGIASIIAALNPKETDCLYYFHDAEGGFHCSVTYEEHAALIEEYY